MNTVTVFLLVVAGILFLLLIAFVIKNYNRIKANVEYIEKTESDIEVLLNQRFDEIKSLLKVVREYKNEELTVIKDITNFMKEYAETNDLGKKFQLETSFEDVINRTQKILEKVPELKSSKNYLQLQKRISSLETSLADRYELYNNSVFVLNAYIQFFPNNIIAKLMSVKKRVLFKVAEEKRDVASLF